MPDETIQARIDAIAQQLDEALEALEQCKTDATIQQRIENANTREIEKLKRHVAKLQLDVQPDIPPAPTTLPIPA